MELRQLEYFVAVAEERNFTRAAERVHISQSGVSAQIRRLESELGAELFDRSARVVTLTVAGKAMLEHARASLAAAASVSRAVGEVTGMIRGSLAVGMVTGCTITPLFDGLAAFHRAHPGVEISLLEAGSEHLVENVHTGTLDMALIGTATLPEGLDSLVIANEPLVAVVPEGHPLADLPRVTLHDLAEHPIVCMPPGTGLRTVFDQACAGQAVQPRIALQASAGDTIADLAARDLAVAILTTSMAAQYQDRLIARTIEDAQKPALLALVWKTPHNPALRKLLAHCRRAFTPPMGDPSQVSAEPGPSKDPGATGERASG